MAVTMENPMNTPTKANTWVRKRTPTKANATAMTKARATEKAMANSRHEQVEYFPFGETWVQNGGNDKVTPYLFTSKELDSETGLYYFGARYYDPRTSVWQSPDPILASYLPMGDAARQQQLRGQGGVFYPININLYRYGRLNPLSIIDPDGNEDIVVVPDSAKSENARMESKALAYSNGTLNSFAGKALNAWAGLKSAFGGRVTEKDVKFFLGTPETGEFSNVSSLPDDPSKQGTIKAGEIYDYKAGMVNPKLPGLKLSSKAYGEGNVPQDPNFNGGVNPAHPTGDHANEVNGAYIHAARKGDMNSSGYKTGSEGCTTCYGYRVPQGLGTALGKSPTGDNGQVLILR